MLPFLEIHMQKPIDTQGLPFGIQTSEFAKVFTTLALARYLSDHTLKMEKV